MPAPRSKQSRLSFNPLPSSSPAAKGYHQQIQDRAAAVTIEGSARKKRKMRNDSNDEVQLDGANDSMPTPAATLERKGNRTNGTGIAQEDDDSDDLPLNPTQRPSTHKRRKTAKQQRLDFTNPREADSFDSPVRLSSSARPESSARAGVFGAQRKRATVISSDSDSDEELPSPATLVANSDKKKQKKDEKVKKSKRSTGDKMNTRSTRRSSQIEPESDEDNIRVSSPRQLPLAVDSEEDDEMPSTMATQRRKRGRKQATPDSFLSSSPPPGPIDSDDDLEIIEPPSKQRRRSRDNESEEEDAEPVTPGRRTLKRPQRKLNRQEAADLAEDLDFLGPSSDVEDSSRKPRNTQTNRKEARLSALQKLKRKRSTQTGQSQPIIVDEDEDDGEEENAPYDEDDGEVEEVQQAPVSSRQYFTANDEDEAFIESGEDDDGVLGAPDSSMPIQYTKFARMKGKQLFPNAVEWMVQKKINPAFTIDDELYDLTFRKLDDEVKGLAGSKFTSSAWTEQFTYALRARPEIAYDLLDPTGEQYGNNHCDACNRSNHPATYQIQFQGKPYYKETLEEVNNDAEDESGHDSDSQSDDASEHDADTKPAWDAEGREIVPVSKIFYVGKFCVGNAQTAHALQHWKYHLNDWVVVWLAKNGYLADAEIVRRDRMSERKRRKHANKIADRMEKEGATEQLWKDFRANIDEARDSKQGRWSH